MIDAVDVRVPASTSNLGPGYDVLGMALSLYANFHFQKSAELTVKGCPSQFCNADNLVLQAFRLVYEKAQETAPVVALTIDSDVPVARGLGSSSTCIVAGLAAANAFLDNRFTPYELFEFCTEIEGHPDNAAPAVFGGLTASFMHEGHAKTVPFAPHEAWRFVAVIPDYEVKTSEARKIVKKDIDLSSAVHSVSHALAMVRGLETGDEALVKAACEDCLHEPYRRTLIKEFDQLKALAQASGAATFFISGSGSTVIAATMHEEVAKAYAERVKRIWPSFGVKILQVCHEGAVVQSQD